MNFDGALEPLSGYNLGIEHEHEHLEDPGQCDADEGLDRLRLTCVESFLGLADRRRYCLTPSPPQPPRLPV